MLSKKIILVLALLGAAQTVMGTKSKEYYNATGKKPKKKGSDKSDFYAAIKKIEIDQKKQSIKKTKKKK